MTTAPNDPPDPNEVDPAVWAGREPSEPVDPDELDPAKLARQVPRS